MTPSTKTVSHRRSLLKGVAVHRVLYQSILNAKLTGRKKLGRKRCTSNRDDCKLENTVKQSRFKHLGELHKSGLKLESVHQESPRSGVFRKRATKPLLKQKQHQKHLTWAKEKNNWTVAQWSKVLFSDKSNFAFHLEIKVWRLEDDWRGTETKLLEVQCEVSEVNDDLGAVMSACVGPLYFIKSKVNAAIYQEIFEHLCFHLLTSFMEMLISFSSRTLAPAHSAKTTSKLFADQITVLDWPANMPDLNPIWNLWDIFKRKMRTVDPTIQTS